MKTAEEIFNTIAFIDKNGDFFNMRREHIIEAMKVYAKQVSEQALKDASEKITWGDTVGYIRKSILQTEIKLP